MITQAIKRWLRNMFAWWPWKHSPPLEYRQASGPLSVSTTAEGISLSALEGTTPQGSITPRLSTIEERPERMNIPPANDIDGASLSPLLKPPVDISTEPGTDNAAPAAPSTPTPQQRLEFLQYLVKRGIVNEGLDD